MKKLILPVVCALAAQSALAGSPALTIYNQDFAVVRDTIHLDLKAGLNDVNYNEATMHLEADSVVLRDPSGRRELQILEQNYRNDPISQALLLNYYEGKTIDFETAPIGSEGKKEIIHGKIVRSGFVPGLGNENFEGGIPNGITQPIIEVDGKLQFRLPGEPLFPTLPDDSILKPTLNWKLNTAEAGPVEAELGYITSGMSWQAAYNLVSPETGDTLDLVGWVTINNHTGKSFEQAKIKLMAGDVNKIQPRRRVYQMAMATAMPAGVADAVTEKAFDEFHLYTLQNPATLLDREMKQVEFIHATGIKSEPIYVYDGAQINPNSYYGDSEEVRRDRNYGTGSNSKIVVMREFMNSASNHLGIPLPAGRLRFYRHDIDGQMEFTGENTIDHTPRDEKIRVTTGNAFDLVGERKRTNIHTDSGRRELIESFEIKLRNHKKKPVHIRVVEHLYRGSGWEITEKSADYTKTDAQIVEFRPEVQPDAQQTIIYTVRYTW